MLQPCYTLFISELTLQYFTTYKNLCSYLLVFTVRSADSD